MSECECVAFALNSVFTSVMLLTSASESLLLIVLLLLLSVLNVLLSVVAIGMYSLCEFCRRYFPLLLCRLSLLLLLLLLLLLEL